MRQVGNTVKGRSCDIVGSNRILGYIQGSKSCRPHSIEVYVEEPPLDWPLEVNRQ